MKQSYANQYSMHSLFILQVIRYSTADERLMTHVFKGTLGFEKAMNYVEQCERRIHDIRRVIRRDLSRGVIKSHLKYGFKAYEFNGPIARKYDSQ